MLSSETRLFASLLLKDIKTDRDIHLWYGATHEEHKEFSDGAVKACDIISDTINLMLKQI